MSTAETPLRPQRIALGVMLIVATAFMISLQDVVFKLSSSSMTLGQIFTLRALIAMPILMAIAAWHGASGGGLRAALSKWSLLRAGCLTLTFLLFYSAIPFVSLATVGAANYIAPIFVTLLSAYVIREAVGPLRWLAVVLGFTGVVVLLKPGADAFSPWAVLPVIGAAFYAVAHIVTRTQCQSVPLPVMALSLNIIMLMAGLAISGIFLLWSPGDDLVRSFPSLFGAWGDVGLKEWIALGVMAAFIVFIGMGLAGAYKLAPPAIVATFEYSYLVFVVLWDYFVFDTSLTTTAMVGMVMIVCAGLLVLRRG